jgi:predicted transcriptional regulator
MTRTDLYRLIDELPEAELHAAARFLEYLRDAGDPLLRALHAAPEDEAAIEEALEDVRAGRIVRHEDLWRRLESAE